MRAEPVSGFVGSLLSGRFEETVIEGGNHAQFGSYGLQKGDGEAALTAEEQQDRTLRAISGYLQKGKRGLKR